MRPIRSVLVGALLLSAGMMTLALAFSIRSGTTGVNAQQSCIPFGSTNTPTSTPDPSPTPDPTPIITGNFRALGAGPVTCTPSPTVRRATRTATPTETRTPAPAEPTSTPRPATAVPSATRPTGGAGAGGVRPPDTGSGGPMGDGGSVALFALAAVLALAGGGVLATAAVKRR